MPSLSELREAFQARPIDGAVHLAGYDPAATPFVSSKSAAKRQLDDDLVDELFDAHELLYANADRSVLLLLQGLDTSGKGGTIKHVVTAMNPSGISVASFVEPTAAEERQHFLERYRERLPEPGQLAVFDRSYYEDVIAPVVLEDVQPDEISNRIEQINQFEEDLRASNTTIVKCLLNISFDEQRERFLRRLRREDKRWKFSESDLETRAQWTDFQAAYGAAIARTSTETAPWYVIPADKKWYRNWAIGQLLLAVFETMELAYPEPDLDIERIRARLEPPN